MHSYASTTGPGKFGILGVVGIPSVAFVFFVHHGIKIIKNSFSKKPQKPLHY
jgi:hypothetical protein